MRQSITLLCVALLGLSAGAAHASHDGEGAVPTGSAADCWKPAFLAADADAVAACYAEDAVMVFPGGPLVQGRAAIRDGYAGFFGDNSVKQVQLTEIGRSGHGDEVTAWGRFTITLVAKEGGAETVSHGRYTDLSRKIDGQWRYVVDHASDEPPAAAPATEAAGAH